MKFRLRPILSEMKELYLKPISIDRFKTYISKIQGDTKDDLVLPISGFNPMGKEHILQKIEALEQLGAERIMDETIEKFNHTLSEVGEQEIFVVLNLADDLKGGWTNYYSSDFDSRFKLNAFVSRNFCVPFFWTSESYTEELIEVRTWTYLRRTLYRLTHPKPESLEEHVEQEIFVVNNYTDSKYENKTADFEKTEAYYLKHKNTEAYDLIFNFFYGNEASENLGYKNFELNGVTGFEYAKFIALKRKANG